ncbi:MAG: hypothetical protein ACREBU_25310 [Nitrososphaera sp.]
MAPRSAFLDKLLSEVRLNLEGPERKVLEQRMFRHLIGQGLPEDKTPIMTLSPRQKFFMDVFQGCSEIYSSFYRLRLAEAFVRKLLRSRSGNADELSYHVEKHLEEVYILKSRIISFLRFLQKRLRRRSFVELTKKVSRWEVFVERAFGEIVKTRGSHVHVERFGASDIKRLTTLDLLVLAGKMNELRKLRQVVLVSAVKEWGKAIKANNNTVENLLDRLFDDLTPIIFDKLAPQAEMEAR